MQKSPSPYIQYIVDAVTKIDEYLVGDDLMDTSFLNN